MLRPVVKKNAILNLRLRPEVRDDFAVVAELRGLSMSGLLHSFIVRSIREERDQYPEAFAEAKRRKADDGVETIKGKKIKQGTSDRKLKTPTARQVDKKTGTSK